MIRKRFLGCAMTCPHCKQPVTQLSGEYKSWPCPHCQQVIYPAAAEVPATAAAPTIPAPSATTVSTTPRTKRDRNNRRFFGIVVIVILIICGIGYFPLKKVLEDQDSAIQRSRDLNQNLIKQGEDRGKNFGK